MKTMKWLSVLLALALVLTALAPITASAAGKTVTVGTQEELEEALKDPTVTKIAIKAKKGKTLTIPEGNYEGIALVVEAAKVKLNNHGTFKVVKVRDAKEYTEHATGNTVKVTAPKLTVTVAETAEVKALHLAKEDAEHKVEIKGEVAKVTVAESAKVDLTVDGTLDTLNVKKASDITVTGTTEETITVNTSADSHGTKVETEVAVDVKAKDFVEVTLNEGAEASNIAAKTEAADVKVDNKTEETVKVETADGTVHEATKEEVVDTRDEEEIVADQKAEEEAGKTEEPAEDEKTEDEKTEDEKAEDEKTEDEGKTDDTTGDNTGSVTPTPETPVTPPVVIPTFTVNFDLNGGTGTANAQTIYYGQTVSAPTAPEKTGYFFGGWYNGSAEYDFATPVTGNITLTAQWANDPAYPWDEVSLQAAFDNGGTVTLREDITLTQGLIVENNVTLNLNGKNITAGVGLWNPTTKVWSLISVRGANGNLVINGNGNVTAIADDSYGLDVRDGAKLVINGGTYVGNISAVYVLKGEATINDGSYSILQKVGSGYKHGYVHLLNCLDENYADGSAKITVTGGTFNGYNPAEKTESTEPGNYMPTGYFVDKAGDAYTVKLVSEANPAYAWDAASLEAAVDKCDYVALANDIVLTNGLVVKKNVTLNLNGKTITAGQNLWNKDTKMWSLISVRGANGNLVINGEGNVTARANDSYGLDVREGAKLVINGGTYVGNISAVYVLEGEATINGGNYSIIQTVGNGYKHGYVHLINCLDANYANKTASIIIKGGSFIGYNPAEDTEGGNPGNYLLAGLNVTESGEGSPKTYTVVAGSAN